MKTRIAIGTKAQRKLLSETAPPRPNTRKAADCETAHPQTPAPATSTTTPNTTKDHDSQDSTSQGLNTQDRNTHINSAQGLTLKASTPLNHVLLSISREKSDEASGNLVADAPRGSTDLALPSLHADESEKLEDIEQVSFTKLELLARQKLFHSRNEHKYEHEQIRFSYIDPRDGRLALVEDDSSLQVAIALFAASGYWSIALKAEAKSGFS